MMKSRRIISLLLVFVMMLGIIPTSFAIDGMTHISEQSGLETITDMEDEDDSIELEEIIDTEVDEDESIEVEEIIGADEEVKEYEESENEELDSLKNTMENLDETEWIEISTANQLAEINGSGQYLLTRDINGFMGNDNVFKGTLDGDGHTIDFVSGSSPLFNTIEEGAEVRNIGITGTINGGGAFAEILNGKVFNSYSWANINNGSNPAGGVAGSIKKGNSAIDNTYVTGNITGNPTGGLVGDIEKGKTIFFFSSYWINGKNGAGKGSGFQGEQKSLDKMKQEGFVNQLNADRFDGITWNPNEQGLPYFGKSLEEDEKIDHFYKVLIRDPNNNSILEAINDKDELLVTDIFGNDSGNVGKLTLEGYEGNIDWIIDGDDNSPIKVAKQTGVIFVNNEGTVKVTARNRESHKLIQFFNLKTYIPENTELTLKIDGEDYTDKSYNPERSQGFGIEPWVSVDEKEAESVYYNLFKWESNNPQIINVSSDGYITIKGEGSATITVSLGSMSKTMTVVAGYTPVTAIESNFKGDYKIHGRSPNSIGQNGTPGVASFNPLRNLDSSGEAIISSQFDVVTMKPGNATYASKYKVESNDNSILAYKGEMQNSLLPFREGTVNLTVTSNDPQLKQQVSDITSVTIKFFNPLNSLTTKSDNLTVKKGDIIDAGLIFKGPMSDTVIDEKDPTKKYRVTESNMNWVQTGKGEVSAYRSYPVIMTYDEDGSLKEGTVSNDKWLIRGVKEGDVTLTGTPVDGKNGAKPITLNITVTAGDAVEEIPAKERVKNTLDQTAAYQLKQNNSKFGSEWAVLGLARAGYSVPDSYYESVYKTAKEEADKIGGRWDNKVTEAQRLALALTSIGKDPRNVNGVDLLDYSWNKSANFPGISGELGDRQGSNELIFALLAVEANNNFKQPDNASISIDGMIDKLLTKYQISDGGFGLYDNETISVDLTAMAIQALSKHYEDPTVKSAVNNAIAKLSLNQGTDGSYGTSEATSQVVLALAEMGINPDTDERFIKGGFSVLDGLLAYSNKDGSFAHSIGGNGNPMATEQALYTLAALDRFYNGKNSLYDMNDVELRVDNGDNIEESLTINVEGLKDGQTLVEQELNFTIKVKTGSIKTMVVNNNGQMITGTDGAYKVILTDGKNTITIEATDMAGNKVDKAYTVIYNKPSTDPTPIKKHINLSIDKLTIKKGYVLNPTKVEFTEGESVWDVLKREMESRDIEYSASDNSQYGSIYIESIDGDGEFDNGSGSGWKYNVNGIYPDFGASAYELKDGDVVQWRYTTNLGKDLEEDLPTEEPIINVESVSLNKLEVKLIEGSTTELKATINPEGVTNKNIIWTSNNEKVAKVDENGKVIALKEGTATITVTTVDGNKTATSIVTVSKKVIIESSPIKQQIKKNLDFILEMTPNPTLGTGGGEWSILSLARGEYKVPNGYYDIYYNNVVEKIKELMPKYSNKLDRNKGTEHSRLILGFGSVGKDITNVGGYDIRDALADFDYVIRQGINGPIFALISLDSNNYEIPTIKGVSNQATRDMFIKYILDREISGGGWSLGGNTSDPDITGMAIQGLTPYYKTNTNVKVAVDRAINWLSKKQGGDGGFSKEGSSNSESISQVVVALTGLGINPHTDARFIKNGNSAIDALMTFALPNGGFMHVKAGGNTGGGAAAGVVDGMATDQGTYALIAYDRLVQGKNSLYDMTDVKKTEKPEEKPDEKPDEEIEIPKNDKTVVDIIGDNKNYKISIKPSDRKKDITVNIPKEKTSKVIIDLPKGTDLPKIEAVKGDIIAIIPKGIKVTSGDSSSIELITSKSTRDRETIDKLEYAIGRDKKLEYIDQAFSMGGKETIEFDDYITLIFKGLNDNDAAYIQNGKLYPIRKYENDSEGKRSNNQEYAYGNGRDLIVKTNHFTDFIAYTTSKADQNKGDQKKGYVTLSIDKLTIDKGYTMRPITVEIREGESVWDVLKREMDRQKIEYDYTFTEKYNSVYVEWIDGDGEFDHGSGSGWKYNVNGWYPDYGASVYKLKDGDVVQWRYTTNLGKDLEEGISNFSEPSIEVQGIKDNQIFLEKEVEFKVVAKSTYKSIKGEAADVTVKLNGKTIRGTKDIYSITLEEGKNTLDILAIDSKGNRKDERYTLIYEPKKQEDKVDKIEEEKTKENLKKIYKDADLISPWAYKDIEEATLKGFLSGSNGNVKPKDNITRAEFTKIIASILNLDINISKNISFNDVNENQWFYPYINAAFNAGIVVGDGKTFNPNDNITREQMAVIIVKALRLKDVKSNIKIKDMNKVSSWAKKDVEIIFSYELMVGNNGLFSPKSLATREMAVASAMRGYHYIDENNIVKDNVVDKGIKDEVKEEIKDEKHLNVKGQIEKTANFMKNTVKDPIVASVGGEWTVLGLSRSNVEVPKEYYEKYYSNLEKTLKEKQGKLHRVKYTEYDRVILALTSIGKGVTDVAGYDLTKPLADFDTLTIQGINGPIFALIALDSNNYEIPIDKSVKTQTTREMLVDFILGREIAGGGWALGEKAEEANPDITGMAIQSLTPYYNINQEVKAAVDRAINWLSKVQKEDGGYSSSGSVNSESISQVIVALTAMGIDPHNDSRFIKNGKSAIDALLSFGVDGDGFYHVKAGGIADGGAKPGEVDIMATDQSMYALVSYYRFVNGQNSLYDMTDVK